MSDLLEYYEKMATDVLEQMLRDDINAVRELPVEDLNAICTILVERNPVKSDAKAAYERFLKYYLPKV